MVKVFLKPDNNIYLGYKNAIEVQNLLRNSTKYIFFDRDVKSAFIGTKESFLYKHK